MIDEAMQFALDYCQEDLTPEETVRRGAMIVQAIHGRLGEINESEGMTTYVLGGVLKKLKTNDMWKMVAGVGSYWSWGDFCKKMTGRSLGACYSKIRVWERAQKAGMTPQEVDKLGWSPSELILKTAKNRDDVERSIALYNELGSREKFAQAMEALDEAKPRKERTSKKRYIQLGATEKEFYDQSLEVAAKKMGKELHNGVSEEEALIFALAEWRESATLPL